MANNYFQFKQFIIHQDRCAMKVTTDACLFGAWAAKRIRNSGDRTLNMLDIGTGTGLLSLMIAQQCDALIDAIEIDKVAAGQAEENVTSSPWKEKIRVTQGDIKYFAKSSSPRYDIVICNPPFYENELVSPSHEKNIAHHSQELLLNEVLQAIRDKLTRQGQFFLLLPFKRMDEAVSLLKKFNLLVTETVLVRQSLNHNFFRVLIAGTSDDNSNEKKYSRNELAIMDEQQQYTKEFIDLLKDYYLYL